MTTRIAPKYMTENEIYTFLLNMWDHVNRSRLTDKTDADWDALAMIRARSSGFEITGAVDLKHQEEKKETTLENHPEWW